jgi:hypothetical protein
MKMYWGVVVETHIFYTSSLVGGERSATLPRRFIPEKRTPGVLWIGDWVGPKFGLIVPELEPRPLCRAARSHSLYQLRYRGSTTPCSLVKSTRTRYNIGEYESHHNYSCARKSTLLHPILSQTICRLYFYTSDRCGDRTQICRSFFSSRIWGQLSWEISEYSSRSHLGNQCLQYATGISFHTFSNHPIIQHFMLDRA